MTVTCPDGNPVVAGDGCAAEHYLVYLAGVAGVSGQALAPQERALLAGLRARLPGAVIVGDVYAYSATNTGLTDWPAFGRLWAWLYRRKLAGGRGAILGMLINVYNIVQVVVSTNPLLGPAFNRGIARAIVESLIRQGYVTGSGVPVTLLGYSGGVQIAVSAARYLPDALGAPVEIISLGGVLSDDPGLDKVARFYHLWGSGDRVVRWSRLPFPGRWHWCARSRWNRALASGRVVPIALGALRHGGHAGYIDHVTHFADGLSCLEQTTTTIARLLTRGRDASPPRAR
jgi:hypothetical protein